MTRILALLACLGLAACSSGTSQAEADPVPTALVTLVKATGGSLAETQTIYGAIEQNADTQFTLAAPAEAVVAQLVRPVGSPVARGQAVVTLRPSPNTSATLVQNQAIARSAQLAYERTRRLRSDGLISDAEVESARAAAQGAQAQARALSQQTGGLTLRAPGAGHVQSIAVSPGDLVSAGATVATIARAGDLRARFGLDPTLLGRLVQGAGVRIATPSGDSAATVPILSVNPSADPQTRLASLYVSVPSGLGIGGGQTLKGEITLQHPGNEVVIPYGALLDDGGQPYVFVVVNGVAHRRDVVPGATNGESIAIDAGLKIGEAVVAKGGTALEDGMKVRTK